MPLLKFLFTEEGKTEVILTLQAMLSKLEFARRGLPGAPENYEILHFEDVSGTKLDETTGQGLPHTVYVIGVKKKKISLVVFDANRCSAMPTACQKCGCSEIEYDQARADAVCTGCGCVLEESLIVSEVGFQENSSGGSNVIGQYVSAEGGTRSLSVGGSFHHGMGRESKEVTLQNGKRRIAALAQQLQLNQHHVDSAYMFFKMALTNRLTRGRKATHIAAACLYLVCRSEGTPHMLLDFSDALQTNVYLLGRAYLHLATALCISTPAVDPCLYIPRFAHKLEFGDQTHAVSMTAMRLVSRMKRDWMDVGRRPAGLCGAALLVAARLHNFNRSQKDIIRVVRVCDATLKKRLVEFERTPSSNLTIDEFLKIDLEGESDPPSFGQMNAKKDGEEGEDGENTGEGSERARNGSSEGKDDAALSEIDRIQSVIEDALGTDEPVTEESSPVAPQSQGDEDGATVTALPPAVVAGAVEDATAACSSLAALPSTSSAMTEDVETALAAGGLTSITGLSRYADDDADKEEEETVNPEEGMGESLSDLDEEEMDGFILSPAEAELKSQMWEEENKEYLAAQKVKLEREEADKAAGIKKPTRKRRPNRTHASMKPCKTAGEAIERVLQEKKISSKINYDVLKSLEMSLATTGSGNVMSS